MPCDAAWPKNNEVCREFAWLRPLSDDVAVLKYEHRKVFKVIKGSEELGDPDEAASAAEEPKEDLLTPTELKESSNDDDDDDIVASFS